MLYQAGEKSPHILETSGDYDAGVYSKNRENEDKIKNRTQHAPEVCERRYQHNPEKRDFCHVSQVFGFVYFPEI